MILTESEVVFKIPKHSIHNNAGNIYLMEIYKLIQQFGKNLGFFVRRECSTAVSLFKLQQ